MQQQLPGHYTYIAPPCFVFFLVGRSCFPVRLSWQREVPRTQHNKQTFTLHCIAFVSPSLVDWRTASQGNNYHHYWDVCFCDSPRNNDDCLRGSTYCNNRYGEKSFTWSRIGTSRSFLCFSITQQFDAHNYKRANKEYIKQTVSWLNVPSFVMV